MYVLAKILMVILGLYGSFLILRDIMMYSMAFTKFSISSTSIVFLISGLLFSVLQVIIIYHLLVNGDKWAAKIVGRLDKIESQEDISWIGEYYRIAAFVCGVLIFFWTIPAMISLIYLTSSSVHMGELAQEKIQASVHTNIWSTILRLALSAYLICGAPHLVRWEVKKTLCDCAKPSADTNTNQDVP
jgi:hypothetical protein